MRIVGLINLIKEKYKEIDIITDLYDSIALGIQFILLKN
jgi:hypothetical protein